MLSRILESRGKPCSCPDGKHCAGCRLSHLKPRVHLEDPHRVTIPIVISRYQHRSPITVNRSTEKRWPFGKERRRLSTPPARPTAFCNWIRKKRAQRKLKAERERERQRERDILRREREIEFIEQLHRQEQYQEEPKFVLTPAPRKPLPAPLITKEKVARKKEPKPPKLVRKKEPKPKPYKTQFKSTTAKPKAESKVVSVKKYCHRQTLSERFVNCFYRCCCQLYCCLTVLCVVAVAVILLI